MDIRSTIGSGAYSAFKRVVTVVTGSQSSQERSQEENRSMEYFESRYNYLTSGFSQNSEEIPLSNYFSPVSFEGDVLNTSFASSVLNVSFNTQGTQTEELSEMFMDIETTTDDITTQLRDVSNVFMRENSVDLSTAFTKPQLFAKLVYDEIIKYEAISLEQYLQNPEPDRKISVLCQRDFDLPKNATTTQKKLNQSLQSLLVDPNLIYNGPDVVIRSRNVVEEIAKCKIRDIFEEIVKSINETGKYKLEVRREHSWDNVEFRDGILQIKLNPKMAKITNARSSLIMAILFKIYDMLTFKTPYTKRSIYYQILEKANVTVVQVNNVIMTVCNMLKLPPWHLQILSGKSGEVYGDLRLYFADSVVNCKSARGSSIPVNLDELLHVESNAYFILLIEKDTIFQKLISDKLAAKLAQPFLMVSARGYGDINTRLFLKMMWKMLKIPIFILVDADPFGIEIMLSYRFGALQTAFLSEELALPCSRWLGIFPSELNLLNIKKMPLKACDTKRINDLLKRPYLSQFPKIEEELLILKKRKFKAEIEGLLSENKRLSSSYLPNRIYFQNFI